MEKKMLENEFLKISICKIGAELSSIFNKKTNTEYLWNGDPIYWKRSAPILFPFVGSLKNKKYIYEGKDYPMEQHGFARDMDFSFLSANEKEIWYFLTSSEETYEKYPFMFRLEIGYILDEKTITIVWKVFNQDHKEMHFSIGGHPAFMCPLGGVGVQTDYYISFDTEKDITYSTVNDQGLIYIKNNILKTEHGLVPVTEDMFDNDTFVIEDGQAHKVSLCDKYKKPYLTVTFDTSIFGIWSPSKKNAPLICIEPWYGRCDSVDFNGVLSEREYGNTLLAGEFFQVSWEIVIE